MPRHIHWRPTFETKILLPVVLVMLVLMLATLWIVNHRFATQLQNDTVRAQATAHMIFKNSQEIRARDLLLRFRNVPNEPRFKAVSQLGDSKTMRGVLSDMLQELGTEVALYFTINGALLSGAGRGDIDVEPYRSSAALVVKEALKGQPKVDRVSVNGRLFDLVAIPVVLSSRVIGTVVFVSEIGNAAAREFYNLADSEVVFLADGHVAVSTLRRPESAAQLAVAFSELDEKSVSTESARQIVLGNEHFLMVGGRFPSLNKSEKIGYLLLSSYEQPLQLFLATQWTLALAGISGICVSIVVIWILIRRMTRPLRELRDSAESVGRGDFSRRVRIESHDEVGEVGAAFNQMTENLAASRENLEKTVETLKTTRAQLTQSEKLSAVGEFVAGVTHELNNPLTSVVGFAELLQEGATDPKQKRHIDFIMLEALRCQKIVKSLLSFARQHKPERKRLNVNEVMEASLNILQYQMKTGNIELLTRLDPKLPEIMGDAHQLQQVFVNILNNARQAIEEHRKHGHIEVVTETVGDRVRITFSDDGPGIPEENLPRIFDPFFTTKEVGKGTGLGLSLTYGTVQEHGGTVTVHSKPGEGATFIIELPIVTSSVSPDAEKTPSKAGDTSVVLHSRKRILVVDDEESILQLISDTLAVAQYRVETARNGETALHKLKGDWFDVVLCDLKMPGLSGAEVYEELRKTDPRIAERVIFMTGDVISGTTQKFMRRHKKLCLSKPFSLQEFRAMVESA